MSKTKSCLGMSADIYSCLLGRKSRIKEEFKVKTCRIKIDKKLQKFPDLLRKNEIYDITFNRLMKVIGEYYGKDNARNKTI